MKRGTWTSLAVLLAIGLAIGLTGTSPCLAADDQATSEECVQKCAEAIQYAKDNGVEKLLEKVNEKGGMFTWKNTYVFCIKEGTAEMVAHPLDFYKSMFGRPLTGLRDPEGKEIFKEMLEVVETRDKGWVNYMFAPGPGQKPRLKVTYVEKIPDTDVIVAAGITP